MTSDIGNNASQPEKPQSCLWYVAPGPLVTQRKLQEAITAMTGKVRLRPGISDYLSHRWVGVVMQWHERAEEAKWKYLFFRRVVIIGGVAIPVLSALGVTDEWQRYAAICSAVVGALVAAAASWEGVRNYGDTWQTKRSAAELLKVEGWLFLSQSGKYEKKSMDQAFPIFVGEVEKMAAAEIGQYISLFDTPPELVRKASEKTAPVTMADIKSGSTPRAYDPILSPSRPAKRTRHFLAHFRRQLERRKSRLRVKRLAD